MRHQVYHFCKLSLRLQKGQIWDSKRVGMETSLVILESLLGGDSSCVKTSMCCVSNS